MNILNKREVPVLLLTGFLGSGKTTLLNRILNNADGYRFAVIVNDLGDVNIDAQLIQRNGLVGLGTDNAPASNSADTIALSNGCICCTLQTDLINQLSQLSSDPSFDYIVIEASGICEPIPIAQTIDMMPRMAPEITEGGVPRLDAIVSVVDALRLSREFDGGAVLAAAKPREEDIAALVIEQIEFCDIVLLNKASEVSPEELKRVRENVRALQPRARIIECDWCDIPLDDILGTGAFSADTVNSAAWIEHLEAEAEAHDEHHHHHHHHHHHDEGECDDPECHCHHHHDGDHDHAAEFGISTFVYYSRRPFDLNKFDYFVTRQWPAGVLRCKGVAYFSHDKDMSYLFEQAGTQKQLSKAGYWYATAPADELEQFLANDPQLRRDWDDTYGDRMNKLVFIGRNIDPEAITEQLDDCLA